MIIIFLLGAVLPGTQGSGHPRPWVDGVCSVLFSLECAARTCGLRGEGIAVGFLRVTSTLICGFVLGCALAFAANSLGGGKRRADDEGRSPGADADEPGEGLTLPGILSLIRDRLRDVVSDREERELLFQLRGVKERGKALRAAEEKGERVEERLEETNALAADLIRRLPRGDNPAFSKLCALSILLLVPLGWTYHALYPVIVEMWGEPETWAANWYIQRHRLRAAHVFRVAHVLLASAWSPVAFVSLLAVLWFVQRKLQRRHARAVMRVLIYLDLLAFFFLTYAVSSLLMLPLGLIRPTG